MFVARCNRYKVEQAEIEVSHKLTNKALVFVKWLELAQLSTASYS